MTTDLALREADALPVWNPKQVVAQVALIQEVMRDVMRPNEHYGIIPGTQKPTLLKPGAEKLCLTFRLAPTYEIHERDLAGGHREYRVTCRLTSIQTGAVIADGVGVCSSMESKYRYRHAEPEDTGKPIPKEYWEAKNKNDLAKMAEVIGGKGFMARKNKAGQWTVHKMADGRVENPDISDTFNTILKMAKKRAHVDASITATGASDIFTQDIEELEEPKPPKEDKAKSEEPKTEAPPAPEPTVTEPGEAESIRIKIGEMQEAGQATEAKITVWCRKNRNCGYPELDLESLRVLLKYLESSK